MNMDVDSRQPSHANDFVLLTIRVGWTLHKEQSLNFLKEFASLTLHPLYPPNTHLFCSLSAHIQGVYFSGTHFHTKQMSKFNCVSYWECLYCHQSRKENHSMWHLTNHNYVTKLKKCQGNRNLLADIVQLEKEAKFVEQVICSVLVTVNLVVMI